MKLIAILVAMCVVVCQVSCYRSLDANIWVPSFERFTDDRGYINNINGFEKLKPNQKQPQNYFDYNSNEEDDDEEDIFANAYSNDFDQDLMKYKKLFSKSLGDGDYGNANNDLDDFLNQYIDSNEEIMNSARDHESEVHSSLVGGYQFVSGGAGEGKQHLNPNGEIPNKEEVKSDIDLPAYCDPPNPCPVGYKGEDCDRRPYEEFTAEYSKMYQSRQNCICDSDHNECSQNHGGFKNSEQKIADLLTQMKFKEDKNNAVVAKKSPRMKRSSPSKDHKISSHKSQIPEGERLMYHVAKKSPHA